MEGVFFQTSLMAAFIAGMVALFAPCCISFLLPAYLGGVFKEKEKVLFMTFIFGLGIFIVLMPAVLGVAFISQMLFRYHDTIYILGGFLMLIVSVTTFLGIKLPFHIPGRNLSGKPDVLSIFVLGIFSGITSACCAPVLIGILTFAFLSPNYLGALLIGGMYVFGMVMPLLLISVFLSGKLPKLAVLRKPVSVIKIFGKEYVLFLSNVIASIIFFIAGFFTLLLTSTGRLSMAQSESFAKFIQNTGGFVNQYIGGNLVINIIFLAIVLFILYKLAKKI
ncbi:MAG: hypothetical protein HYT08_03765 [Candidatus Levybacteria bacterium]|nr:hypothetical protein [Candidatus Levybacteria bacterium]